MVTYSLINPIHVQNFIDHLLHSGSNFAFVSHLVPDVKFLTLEHRNFHFWLFARTADLSRLSEQFRPEFEQLTTTERRNQTGMASCLLERTAAERVTCMLFAETAESFEAFCDFGGHLMVMDALLVLKSYK